MIVSRRCRVERRGPVDMLIEEVPRRLVDDPRDVDRTPQTSDDSLAINAWPIIPSGTTIQPDRSPGAIVLEKVPR